MKLFSLLFPFMYAIIAIVAPVLIFKTNYGISVLLLFWVPSVLLYIFLCKKMDKLELQSFWVTTVLLIPVTFVFEYLSLILDIWNFSQEYQKLWGPRIWGAPIEEFIFWFGATPFCLLLYHYYNRLLRRHQ